jgi:1-acyl-sn-glycerol-3-phosphate acyltransferase
MVYRLVRFFINLITILTVRLDAEGLEKLPREGAAIITSNHLGRLDVPLVWYVVKRNDIIVIVAEKYQKSALLRWLTHQLDAIFVDRYHADFNAMRQVLEKLKRGGVFVVAPEGTRSQTEALIEGRPGAAYLAAKAGVPVYPVAVAGTEDRVAKQRLKRLRRIHVRGWVGEPYVLPPLPPENRDQVLQEYTDEMMCRIAALLPEEYRGVYADHPRLKALLGEDRPLPEETRQAALKV